MNYSAALTDFFKSSKWVNNLLLGGVCLLIPIVGPIALIGWHGGALFGRSNYKDFHNYPEFEFSKFNLYLERGVWPFLVQLIISMVMIPLLWMLMAVPMFALIALAAAAEKNQAAAEASPLVLSGSMLFTFGGFALGIVLMALLVKPLMLRALLLQDLGAAFNLTFIKRFIALTWLEQVLCSLFLLIAGLCLMLIGMLAFCIGVYFMAGWLIFSTYHLDRQLYDLYLARGGEPLPVSPKLLVTPPASMIAP